MISLDARNETKRETEGHTKIRDIYRTSITRTESVPTYSKRKLISVDVSRLVVVLPEHDTCALFTVY